MSYERYKSDPYYDSGYPTPVTDEQIAKHASKAFVIGRRGRKHSPNKSTKKKEFENPKNNEQQALNLNLRDTRFKKEIIREIHAQLPGSLNICIPIRMPALYQKQSKFSNKQNDQLNKLKNDLEEMKTKMKRQDETIEHLRQQLEKKDTTAPPPSSPSS